MNPSGQQQAKNGVTWNPLLRARPGQANAPNIFRIKTGVHPAIRIGLLLVLTTSGNCSWIITC